MAYLRFIVSEDHPDTGVADGLFGVAHAVRDAEDTSSSDRESLTEQLKWFTQNLPIPKRFNRSTSKGYYRRNTKGIAWFRDSALEHISRMHEMKRIVEANGHIVHIVREDRIGYVVYEDDAQVIAEPFADTRTRT
jgi:hypothetical protein